MEFKAVRKIVNRKRGSGMVSIPPYFLENMGALGCREVVMTVPDKDHILIEVVRTEEDDIYAKN
ncbi:MAG: hypothetical protein B2I17_01675 [Thermoplasmatales archaeon B_DKE]|nr:MAG: hypothetical protein B2I17_01675 [Thermoplasmatales archaeon B_DKE]